MTCQLTKQSALHVLAFSFVLGGMAGAQQPISTADSTLVRAILLAEDRRDASAAALAEGARHSNPRISVLARRALGRIRDPKFAARDSLPPLPAPPKYDDPAWRLRLRAVNGRRTDCPAMRAALADSAWPVRFLAADRVAPECGADAALVATLESWVSSAPTNARRSRGGVSWQPAAHGITALARLAPARARAALPGAAASPVPWLRTYAARAAGTLKDTVTLRRLARDPNDNVKEAAIDALASTAGHTADDEYVAALSATGYQAVRAGARALKGSPRGRSLLLPLLEAERRIAKDSSETSRDARIAIIERLGEVMATESGFDMPGLAGTFDCVAMRVMDSLMTRNGASTGPQPRCTPLAITLPPDAVALALGQDVRLRVTMADSSGGGSFIVKLRGDVAPIMAGRVLALARAGYYDGLTWHRVEHDFVVQGGGKANEYVGHPRFMRDELGTVPHARGTVGMSTRGHDTGDAQWFFNLRDNLRLNTDYTVFAEVTDGIDVVDGVLEGDVIARIEVLPAR